VATSTVNQGTQRRDNWQLEPILSALALLFFIAYATYRALQNQPSEVPGTHYISPLYSPYLPHLFHAIGVKLPGLEKVLPNGSLGWALSPALFIMWVPAGFRATCYFYRRVYYRSFFTAPVACAVDAQPKSPLIELIGKGKHYMGEKVFPMVLMNLHRYFFYLAALFIFLHVIDLLTCFFLPDYSGVRIGMGSFVIALDVILLSLYAFSCHSWRHLLGGQVDCFSSCPMNQARGHAWERQSLLNTKHGLFGWISLFWVIIADVYMTLASQGVIKDFVFYTNTWKGIFG